MLLVEAFNANLLSQQVAGALDLFGVAVGIWTVWSSISLPLGGNLQRAFRLIGIGALAFACSHVIDTLAASLGFLSDGQVLLLMQTTVLISMLFFVPGLARLADLLPTLPAARKIVTFPRIWPFALPLIIVICSFSFIFYGVSPEGEIVALIGLDGSLVIIACLCILMVARARIGGVVGGSLWTAMLGLLLFCLAHPLQALLYEQAPLPDGAIDVLHRLIIMPALLLFAISITKLGRKLSFGLLGTEKLPALSVPTNTGPQHAPGRKALYRFSARARARRNFEREQLLRRGSTPSRPFPALRQRVSRD